MEPIGIVVAVSFSTLLLGGLLMTVKRCMRPRMKESRSDTDLAQLNAEL